MRRLFPIALMGFGVVFFIAGLIGVWRGFDARSQVSTTLASQNITTPEDASIPNTRVLDSNTAIAMAQIIDRHVREDSGGLTYADMGRFVAEDDPDSPVGTSNEEEALIGENGRPVPNPARAQALTAAGLQTSLYSSAMAFGVSELVIWVSLAFALLGLVMLALGFALLALVTPELAERVGVRPVVPAP